MKFIYLTTFIIFALCFNKNLSAQQYIIKTSQGILLPAHNAETFIRGEYDSGLTSTVNDREVFVIQFESLPGTHEKKQLASKGIALHDYVGGNAYVASRKHSSLKSAKLQMENDKLSIRAVFNTKKLNKLSGELKEGNYPPHIRCEDDKIEIAVCYLNIVSVEFINNFLNKQQISGYNIDSKYQIIYMTIAPVQLETLVDQPWIIRIEGKSRPVQKQDILGQTLIGSGGLSRRAEPLAKYTGKGVSVGVWDGDVEAHVDLRGRLRINENGDNGSPHGTHVACVLGGRGLVNPLAEGIATDVHLETWNYEVQENGLYNYQEMDYSAENQGIVVSQNSYGATGLGGDFPEYHHRNRMLDKVAWNYPELTMVFSAGNSRGISHMLGNDGYRTVCRSAKNGITVGAVDAQKNICSFSSFGPTHNGRMAPLVCAFGDHVFSGAYSNQYLHYDGTSQAAPAVSGVVAQLCQAYRGNNNGDNPPSALMKAVICNSASDLGNAGPDYSYGYGLTNAPQALEVIEKKQYFIAELEHNETQTFSIRVPGNVSCLKAMLVWTDPVSDVESESSVINNLDLKIVAEGQEYLPWILDPYQEKEPAKRGIDTVNNIEQVTIDTPSAGIISLEVSGTQIPQGSQSFALVYCFEINEPRIVYPLGGETLETNKTATLRWDCHETTSTVKLEISKDGGDNYELIGDNIKASLGYLDYRMPQTPARARFRLSADGKTKESGVFFLMGKPAKPNYTFTSSNSAKITWAEVEDCTAYEVLKVGAGEVEVLARVSSPSYTLTGLEPSDKNWFSVRAIEENLNITGPRCEAFEINPVKTIQTLPLAEDFEKGNPVYFGVQCGSNVTFYFDFDNFVERNRYCLIEGGEQGNSWQEESSDEALWEANSDFKFSLESGTVDGTVLDDLLLSFDLGQLGGKDLTSNSVRVCIDGNPIVDVQGTVYHKPVQMTDMKVRRKYYNLNPFLGKPFKISIEVLCRRKRVADKEGDVTIIDNIHLGERLENNIAILDGVYPKTGTGLGMEELAVDLVNLGKNTVSDFDLVYLIDAEGNKPQQVTENITKKLEPFGNLHYSFNIRGDFSDVNTIHTLKFFHRLADDLDTSNDTLFAEDIDNYGNIVLMPVEGYEQVITNDTIFTDPGSQKGYYPPLGEFGIITFKPRDLTSVLEVSFEKFQVADPEDHLLIYSGSEAEGTPLADYSGDEIPPTVSSIATDGSLTFAFSGSMFVYWSGWVARIQSVPKPNLHKEDLGIVAFREEAVDYANPTSLNITLGNYGSDPISSFEVCYQVDNGQVVKEQVNAEIKPGQKFDYVFNRKEDFSKYGGKYDVKIYTRLIGDTNWVNDTITTIVSRSYPPASGNGDMYIEKVEIAGMVNESGKEDYARFIEKEASLSKSTLYELKVTMSGFYVQPSRMTGWIDWDNNGIFSERERLNFRKQGLTFTADVMADFSYGLGTKCMRLRLYDGNKIGNPEPLGSLERGEVEDYTIRLMSATSVKNPVSENVKLYPNPSAGRVTLENIQHSNVMIFNSSGILMQEFRATGYSKTLDLAKLNKGLYIVVITNKGFSEKRKLLLK